MNTADATSVVYHLQHSRTRPQLTRIASTWGEFSAVLVAGHIERDDKDGPGFVLAEMSKPYRAAANVTRFDAVLLDMDSHGDTQPPPPDIAAEMLAASGLAGVVYTTHSHTDDAPRYRVVVPLAEPVLPADLQRVTRAAADAIGLTGEALDPKSWVVGQFFYLPSCRPDAPRFAACLDGAAFEPPVVAPEPLALPVADPEPTPAPDPRPATACRVAAGASLYDAAKARARGQWRGILSSLGISVPDRERAHAPCPGCGGKDRFRFDDKDGGGSFICSQGGAGTLAGDGFDLVRHARRVDAAEALRLVCDSLGIQRRAAPSPAPAARRAEHDQLVDEETGEILGEAPPPANDNDQAGAAWPDPIDPFGVALPPPLPLDVLPEALRDYVADQSALLGCDPGIIGLSAVVAAAACIHDEIELQPKRHDPTWVEQPRLWLAIVGDPSAKKSPALKKAMRQVNRIDMRLAGENVAAEAEYQRQHEAWKEAKKAKGSGDIPEPKKPKKRRLVAEDITVESLSEVLRDNAAGVLTYKDELTGWFASMDAYKGGSKGASMDRAHWLEAYNGGRRLIDRVQRGNIIVPNWSTCIIGGIQPDMMRRISASMGNDGLLQRFMVLVARPATMDEDRVPDMAAMDRFRDLFEHLFSIAPSGTKVRLSDAAHVVRERVARRADTMLRAFDSPHIVAWLGKWTGLFARLLLTYHVIECSIDSIYPSAQDVSEATALQVERLMCDVLLRHAIYFYNEVIDQHERHENVRQLARLILAKQLTRITKRDLTLYWKASRKLGEWDVRAVMETLATMAWLAPDIASVDVLDGKPRAWIVNPLVHDLFAKQAESEMARRQAATELIREMRAGTTRSNVV